MYMLYTYIIESINAVSYKKHFLFPKVGTKRIFISHIENNMCMKFQIDQEQESFQEAHRY